MGRYLRYPRKYILSFMSSKSNAFSVLLKFMKWPFINARHDFTEHLYGNLRADTWVKIDVWDWHFGTALLGGG